jgi:hypothetical protein
MWLGREELLDWQPASDPAKPYPARPQPTAANPAARTGAKP